MKTTEKKPKYVIEDILLPLDFIKSGKKYKFNLIDGSVGVWNSINGNSKPCVMILARDKNQKFILINLFRFPVENYCHELPGGIVEEDEKIEDAVCREFEEETGYVVGTKLIKIAEYWVFNGKTNAKAIIYFTSNCHQKNKPLLDPIEKAEQLRVKLLSLNDLYHMIECVDPSIDPSISVGLLGARVKNLL